MNHPIVGMRYLLNGFNLITQRGLRRFVVIPLLINIAIFVGLFFLLGHFMQVFNQWFTQLLPAWLHWLQGVLWIFFFLGFFIIIVYAFVTVANLVSAPFNSFLAEKVELYLTGNLVEERSLLENIKDIPRIIGRQLFILGYYIPRIFMILVLFLVPVIHLIAPLLLFLFNAWFMAMTYLDYPTDNHRIPIHQVRVWMEMNKATSLGFGASILIFSMLPLVNCLVIPAAVAGATQFWVEKKL